mmetsp:Transcript_42401/g.70511  ORF Transcript_42401/g.70511 Transcript_42401/m.70511 type:complete len:86 (+) Transcript_42401:247-504(+)
MQLANKICMFYLQAIASTRRALMGLVSFVSCSYSQRQRRPTATQANPKIAPAAVRATSAVSGLGQGELPSADGTRAMSFGCWAAA